MVEWLVFMGSVGVRWCTRLGKGTGLVPPPPPPSERDREQPPPPPQSEQGAGCVLCLCEVLVSALHACLPLVCFNRPSGRYVGVGSRCGSRDRGLWGWCCQSMGSSTLVWPVQGIGRGRSRGCESSGWCRAGELARGLRRGSSQGRH